MTLLIIDMDFQPGIDCTTFHSFFSWKVWKKKKFFKILESWQVCDWLAKWIIMLRFMDLRWPRVFRRSNAGLVIECTVRWKKAKYHHNNIYNFGILYGLFPRLTTKWRCNLLVVLWCWPNWVKRQWYRLLVSISNGRYKVIYHCGIHAHNSVKVTCITTYMCWLALTIISIETFFQLYHA